ncbi:hypothetical protein BWQ96_07184 [Gracilariopsis chorda]|uniref:Uncharacterized protein n=1 Tax=Gracilariopsis chorda TaxID=448386 RepID=A0A2V3IM13_9FLOR|nr:hypothetical protein BWQ96_07184 [Gracilariopsis chorda]|eukprot:PXF43098.1 hypothetical protein BWQ96_07184 [Gracilariopsis chorda]
MWCQLYGRLLWHATQNKKTKEFTESIETLVPRPWVRASPGILQQASRRAPRIICRKGHVICTSFEDDQVWIVWEDGEGKIGVSEHDTDTEVNRESGDGKHIMECKLSERVTERVRQVNRRYWWRQRVCSCLGRSGIDAELNSVPTGDSVSMEERCIGIIANAMGVVGEDWVSPDTEFDHRRLPGRTPISRRRMVLPSPVDEYVAAAAEWFDASRFSAIRVRPSIGYRAGNKRLRDGAWEARWGHM